MGLHIAVQHLRISLAISRYQCSLLLSLIPGKRCGLLLHMQRGLCACVFLSLLVTSVSLAKTGKSIEVPFGRGLRGGGQKKTIAQAGANGGRAQNEYDQI